MYLIMGKDLSGRKPMLSLGSGHRVSLEDWTFLQHSGVKIQYP